MFVVPMADFSTMMASFSTINITKTDITSSLAWIYNMALHNNSPWKLIRLIRLMRAQSTTTMSSAASSSMMQVETDINYKKITKLNSLTRNKSSFILISQRLIPIQTDRFIKVRIKWALMILERCRTEK